MSYQDLLQEVCEGVRDILNGQTFTREFVAKRGYNPRRTLKNLETLTVVVVPAAIASESMLDRGHLRQTPAVYIGVLERLNDGQCDGIEGDEDGSLQQIDDLMTLCSEIRAAFLPTPGEEAKAWALTSGRVIMPTTVTTDPAYDHGDMQDKRQFTSVTTVTFTVDQP